MPRYSLIDAPIGGVDDDSLELGVYVQAMSKFIRACETPLTIGIQGDWGIGKTSFLNMIQEDLQPRQGRRYSYPVVYFNTWQYSQFNQEEMLGLSVLRGIVDSIKEQARSLRRDDQSRETLVDAAKKFGQFVGVLGNQVLKQQTGCDVLGAAEAVIAPEDADMVSMLSNVKAQFQELVDRVLEKEGDRLIIMIDDLDRIRPLRALELLEALKNFLDVRGCVFLIAVDYSVIQMGMEEKLGKKAKELQGRSYFDKIIQVPFTMPTNAYKIDKYIMSMLGAKREDGENYRIVDGDCYLKVRMRTIGDDVAAYFLNMTRLTVGSNPRSLKRLVNYATLLKIVVVERRQGSNIEWKLDDAKMLYALAAMQLAWPEVFAMLVENASFHLVDDLQDYEFLETCPRLTGLFARVHNPEEVKSNIVGFFDELMRFLDIDDNEAITQSEFSRLTRMMQEANMFAVQLSDFDAQYDAFVHLVEEAVGSSPSIDVQAVLDLLRHPKSRWSDRSRFELRQAGKRFREIFWDKRQVGALVSTAKEPIQMYLRCTPEQLCAGDKGLSDYLIDVSQVGHYGKGDCKVDILKALASGEGVDILNRVHEQLLATRPKVGRNV